MRIGTCYAFAAGAFDDKEAEEGMGNRQAPVVRYFATTIPWLGATIAHADEFRLLKIA